jgi:hypothetical protein
MSFSSNSAMHLNRTHVPTEEAAYVLSVQPQTMRKQYSACGAYCGIRPTKARNGRLYWSVEALNRLVKGEEQ